MPKKGTKKTKAVELPTEGDFAVMTPGDQQALNYSMRVENLERKKAGRPYGKSFAVVDTRKSKKQLEPITIGLGERSNHSIPELSFRDRIQGAYDLFKDATPLEPKDKFTTETRDREEKAFRRILSMTDTPLSEDLPILEKKIRKKIEQEKDYLNSYYGHYGTILPEYDQYEPFTMLDTEAYLLQATRRKHSLMFRQGFKIEGENPRFTKYVNSRLNTIGYMMGMTIENFIKDILYNLLIISNCFLLKIRDQEASGGTANPKNDDKVPVAAYMILPPHSIFPFVNQKGEIIKWRRYYGSARKYKDYRLDDVIHFRWDVKPGHVYGTPRTTPVRDDIFALRRLEENVEMLLINHLFPLFHVQVGSKDAPATMLVDGITEVDLIKAELENMPKEGVFVTDERVAVDVVGIKGEAPDPQEIMQHYKKRIFTGLGVSPIDMAESDCHDALTEVLTETGWKFHNDFDWKTTKIATYDSQTKTLKFDLPEAKHESFYSGKMVQFKSKHLDLKVTPHHDIWVSPRLRKGFNWQKVKAQELVDDKWSEFYLLESPENGLTVDTNVDTVLIPSYKPKRGRSSDTINCQVNDFAEFLGYFVSEGSLDVFNASHGRYRVLLSQNCGHVYEKMKKNLDNLNLHYNVPTLLDTHKTKTIKIYGQTLYRYLEANVGCGAHHKKLPQEVYSWPAQARLKLLLAAIDGDGAENRGGYSYYSASKELADGIQRLAISLGFRAKVNLAKQDKNSFAGSDSFIYKVFITTGQSNSGYRLVNKSMLSMIDYTGTVFCYTVPSHLFMTRRNGKVSIQGNSGNRATAENVSQNLKDSVKTDLNWFCGQFKMYVLKEMFEESPTNLSVQNALLDINLVFPDIDVDGHIKWENHVIEKFNNHLITEPEARRALQQQPMSDKQTKLTHYQLHVKDLAISTIREKNKGMLEAAAARGLEAAEVGGTKSKISPASKAAASVANKNRPANQHGRNLDPHSARSSMDPNLLYDLLMLEMDQLHKDEKLTTGNWRKSAQSVIDKYVGTCLREAPENYYTNQERQALLTFAQTAKDRVAQTRDRDIISVLLEDLADTYFEEPNAETDPTEDIEPRTETELTERTSG